MRGSVNPVCRTGNHGVAALGQASTELLGDPLAIRRGGPRPTIATERPRRSRPPPRTQRQYGGTVSSSRAAGQGHRRGQGSAPRVVGPLQVRIDIERGDPSRQRPGARSPARTIARAASGPCSRTSPPATGSAGSASRDQATLARKVGSSRRRRTGAPPSQSSGLSGWGRHAASSVLHHQGERGRDVIGGRRAPAVEVTKRPRHPQAAVVPRRLSRPGPEPGRALSSGRAAERAAGPQHRAGHIPVERPAPGRQPFALDGPGPHSCRDDLGRLPWRAGQLGWVGRST